jgi:hypothetical protein
MKIILARLLLRYDVKFKEGDGRSEDMRRRVTTCPNMTAKILFRKRVE